MIPILLPPRSFYLGHLRLKLNTKPISISSLKTQSAFSFSTGVKTFLAPRFPVAPLPVPLKALEERSG